METSAICDTMYNGVELTIIIKYKIKTNNKKYVLT